MANDNKGISFTEDNYLSKEAISAHYNLSNVEQIWSQVAKYRAFFRLTLPLKTATELDFSVVLTKNLLKRLYGLERKLTGLLLETIRFKPQDLIYLTQIAEVKELRALATTYNLAVDETEIQALRLQNKVPAASHAILANYAQAQRALAKAYLAPLDGPFVDNLNRYIQGLTAQEAPESPTARQLKPLWDFLEQDDEIPLLAKTIIAIFWFRYTNPYEYFNTETATLLAKAYLANQGYYGIAYLLPFETFIFPLMEKMERVFTLAIKTRDLTYIIDSQLIYFEQAITAVQDYLRQTQARVMAREEQLALPLDTNNQPAPVNTANLLEEYPTLTKKQADFYLTHHTVGHFYTIEQFKTREEVAYETARTSMELLTRLGFYSKNKTNKHFTYTPIPKEGASD